jgi:hypothetical protein
LLIAKKSFAFGGSQAEAAVAERRSAPAVQWALGLIFALPEAS